MLMSEVPMYMKDFLEQWLMETTHGLSTNERLSRQKAEGNHVSAREWRPLYRGTSLIRSTPPVGPYSNPMPRTIWRS